MKYMIFHLPLAFFFIIKNYLQKCFWRFFLKIDRKWKSIVYFHLKKILCSFVVRNLTDIRRLRILASRSLFKVKKEKGTWLTFHVSYFLFLFFFFDSSICFFYRCSTVRTPANNLILNLAISDFMIMIEAPLYIYNALNFGPAIGEFGKLAHKYFCSLNMTHIH